jgi:hypothetical protein
MTASRTVWDRIKDVDMFFQKNDPVHKTMRRTIKKLEKANIPYALVGGMAVNAHGYRRTTNDVDFLLTADGLAEFQKRFVPKFYDATQRPRRFTDRKNQVIVDFLVTGLFPGSGKPGPIVFPDPTAVRKSMEGMQVIDMTVLIELKLAARRHQDFADVVALIRAHQLDESFADRLHPSLRSDYIECLEEKRREEEYEARQ